MDLLSLLSVLTIAAFIFYVAARSFSVSPPRISDNEVRFEAPDKPSSVAEYLRQTDGHLEPAPPPHNPRYAVEPRRFAIQAAIKQNWRIAIVYEDEKGEVTERVVTPYEIFGGNRDMFRGHCHLRDDERRFRMDRIRDLEVGAQRATTQERYRCRG